MNYSNYLKNTFTNAQTKGISKAKLKECLGNLGDEAFA